MQFTLGRKQILEQIAAESGSKLPLAHLFRVTNRFKARAVGFGSIQLG
jgi:hypothetical protein